MSALSGTGPLLGLALRRDRILIPASVIALTIYAVGSAQATVALYADAQTAMAELGSVLNSPSTLTLYGPATTTSIEGLSIFKTLLMGSVFVGLLAFAIVRRHTRVEEDVEQGIGCFGNADKLVTLQQLQDVRPRGDPIRLALQDLGQPSEGIEQGPILRPVLWGERGHAVEQILQVERADPHTPHRGRRRWG